MKRCLVAFLVLAALLAGCTGTTEPRPPTLLVVGYAAASGPTLALVEDGGPTAGQARLQFVAGSERALLADAVAIDVEDRDFTRASAWVLVRAQTTSGGVLAVQAWLQRFAVAGIDAAAPAAFAEDPARRVVLSGSGGVLVDPGLPGRTVCPSALQVTRNGQWALILDDPAACGEAGFPVQWLLNTVTGSASALRATADVLATSPYTDQVVGGERGYFLVSAPGGAQVYATDFTNSATWLGQARLGDSSALVDMAGSGSVLVGLTTSRLTSLDLSDPSATPTAATLEVNAGPWARLVTDPLGATTEVLVLNGNRVALHRTPGTPEVGPVLVAAAAGSIDPINRFAYLLTNGSITLVDLLTGLDEYDTPLQSGAFDVPELTLATGADGRALGVITWVRALATATP